LPLLPTASIRRIEEIWFFLQLQSVSTRFLLGSPHGTWFTVWAKLIESFLMAIFTTSRTARRTSTVCLGSLFRQCYSASFWRNDAGGVIVHLALSMMFHHHHHHFTIYYSSLCGILDLGLGRTLLPSTPVFRACLRAGDIRTPQLSYPFRFRRLPLPAGRGNSRLFVSRFYYTLCPPSSSFPPSSSLLLLLFFISSSVAPDVRLRDYTLTLGVSVVQTEYC